jgi:cation-transporting ATPase E
MEIKGLTTEEVNERKRKGLSNKTSKIKSKTLPEIIIENLFSVFNIIIFIVVVFLFYFYLHSADNRLLMDSVGVTIVAFFNTILAIFQEIRAKKALDKVSLMLQKTTVVLRDGKESMVDNSDIVLDDVVLLKRGDQVIADGRVLVSMKIYVDESLITGESLHLSKKENDNLFSGSYCVSGSGYYLVEKTGDECYTAVITKMAKKYKFSTSPLQNKINLIVKFLFVSALILVALELIFGRTGNYGEVRMIRKIASIIIALIPQGLVLMISVIYAFGILRISRIGAIINKLNAIESFSNIKVVCMDKTGTLTQNNLAVIAINYFPCDYSETTLRKILSSYALSSSEQNETIRTVSLIESSAKAKIINELPFNSELKFSAAKLSLPEYGIYEKTFILGAYDILSARSAAINPIEVIESENLLDFRNLMFGLLPDNISLEVIKDSSNLPLITPLVLISINDQVRLDAAETIKIFKQKGIEFKILSGDSPGAVRSILRELSWDVSESEIITGMELENIGDEQLYDSVKNKVVFARLQPQHKLRIIKSLRGQKIYTAMIGDGVNDIPAIKESDIGIAMEEGSKSTKEIADIVLLKNRFSLLPEIFNEGKKIINTSNAVSKLFLTKNFMVVFITLFSLIFAREFPLTPTRISLFNIFAIGLPAFLFTAINKNCTVTRKFFTEVISFVLISSFVIVTFGYIGELIAKHYFIVSRNEIQLLLLAIFLLTTIFNFVIIVSDSPEKEKKIYLLYAVLFALLNVLLATIPSHLKLIYYLKIFYDVEYINVRLWLIIIPVSLSGSLVLWFLQKLRHNLIIKSFHPFS